MSMGAIIHRAKRPVHCAPGRRAKVGAVLSALDFLTGASPCADFIGYPITVLRTEPPIRAAFSIPNGGDTISHVPISTSQSSSAAMLAPPLPPQPILAAQNSTQTTKTERWTTPTNPAWFTLNCFFQSVRRRSFLSELRSGTLWRGRKSSGTANLPAASSWRCRESCLTRTTSVWCGNIAGSSL